MPGQDPLIRFFTVFLFSFAVLDFRTHLPFWYVKYLQLAFFKHSSGQSCEEPALMDFTVLPTKLVFSNLVQPIQAIPSASKEVVAVLVLVVVVD